MHVFMFAKIFCVVLEEMRNTMLLYSMALQIWQLKFNISKFKYLRILVQLTIMIYIILMEFQLILLITSHNDLGILFDDKLKFHNITSEVTTKANQVLSMIKKSL